MNQNTNKKSYPASPSKMFQKSYTVPHDYDQTPKTLLPLDHYLLDSDINSLIKMLFSDVTNWSTWAKEYKEDALGYMSPPFSTRNAFELGYC